MTDRTAASAIIYDAWLRETSKRITDLAVSCVAFLKEHNDMVQRGTDGIDNLSDTERAQRTQTIFNAVNDIGDRLEALRQLEGLRQVSIQLASEDGHEEPVERAYDA